MRPYNTSDDCLHQGLMACCTICGAQLRSLLQLELHHKTHHRSSRSVTDAVNSSNSRTANISSRSDVVQRPRSGPLVPTKSILCNEVFPSPDVDKPVSSSSKESLETSRLLIPAKEMYMANKIRTSHNSNGNPEREVVGVCDSVDHLQVNSNLMKSSFSIPCENSWLSGAVGSAPSLRGLSKPLCKTPVSHMQIGLRNFSASPHLSDRSTPLDIPILKAMSYKVTVESIVGIDIQVQLKDVIIEIEKYHFLSGSEPMVLKSLEREVYQNSCIKRSGTSSFDITLGQPLEFVVKQNCDVHLLIITFKYRGSLLFWASHSSGPAGPWESVLRRPPVHMSSVMSTTDNCFLNTLISGTVKVECIDVLDEAYMYMTSPTPLVSKRTKVSFPSNEPPLSLNRSAVASGEVSPVELPPQKPQTKNVGHAKAPEKYKPLVGCNTRFSDFDVESDMNASTMLGFSSVNKGPVYLVPVKKDQLNEVNVNIRLISGLPLNAASSRAVVYVLNYVDKNTGEVMNNTKGSFSFMEPPTVVQFQYPQESMLYPNLNIDLKNIMVTEETHVVVIIEYITMRGTGPYVFGHLCLPIHSRSIPGNFISRIKLGDPRQTLARDVQGGVSLQMERVNMEKYSPMQIEEVLDSQALCDRLFLAPSTHAECCPGAFLVWCLNSNSDAPYCDVCEQPIPSKGEVQLHEARRLAYVHHRLNLNNYELNELFKRKPRLMGNRIGYVVPYDPMRGFFMVLESLHGMEKCNALHAVIIDTGMCNPSGLRATIRRNWLSDVGAPRFDEPMQIFEGILPDMQAVVMIYLLRVTINSTSISENTLEPSVGMVGWSIIRLFCSDGVLCQGRYVLPWFSGSPPDELLEQLETQTMEVTVSSWVRENRIKYMEPPSTAVVSIGDPIIARQILSDHPGRPLPEKLLIPSLMENSFPSGGYEGAVGCSQWQLVESMGLSPGMVDNTINTCVRAYVHASLVD